MATALMVGAAWLGVCGAAMASGTIVGLGVVPGSQDAEATGVSADGRVVVGNGFYVPSPESVTILQPWRWTAGTGVVQLATLPGAYSASVLGVSADGAICFGSSNSGTFNVGHAVRWTGLGSAAIQDLGVPGYDPSWGVSSNADGTVVLGFREPASQLIAFRWVALQGYEELAAVTGGVAVYAMSADERTFVGLLNSVPVRWTAAGGAQGLGLPAWSQDESSTPVGVNADGSVVFGRRLVYAPYTRQTFRWTAAGGVRIIALDSPMACSPEGDVVVGYLSSPGTHDRAAIWTPALGGVELGGYLASRGVDVTGWQLIWAKGVSSGGRVIVGDGMHTVNGVARQEAFIATLDGGVPRGLGNWDGGTGSPVLTVNDFACFLNRFAAGENYANCDGSSVAPALNVLDFTCFLDAFAAGCP